MFLRADRAERRLCMWANAAARRHGIRSMFRVVSRLGDGVIWYALIVLVPLLRAEQGLVIAVQMLVTGGAGLLLYKLLKNNFVRERPYVRLIGIECAMPPLDRYSFPSGHTLHAVLFTTLAVTHVPQLAIVLVTFSVLVAMSRVVLGLHYPTDVLVGAALGALLAVTSNALFF
ncbi:MAG: phosphatase PAP2 family protein [Steroidobacteraceae bacterium]